MASPDLHTRLVESLSARLAMARAATPGPWATPGPDTVGQWVIYDDQWAVAEVRAYHHDEPYSNKPGARGPAYIDSDANAAYIAANAPDVEIRRVEAALELCRIYAEAKVYYEANRSAPAGELHGLLTALKMIAAGEGIEP